MAKAANMEDIMENRQVKDKFLDVLCYVTIRRKLLEQEDRKNNLKELMMGAVNLESIHKHLAQVSYPENTDGLTGASPMEIGYISKPTYPYC